MKQYSSIKQTHTNKRKIEIGADLIRCVAIWCVIGVHFLLHNNYYQTSLEGPIMLLYTFILWLCYTCVPLFMLLTGYLCSHYQLTKKYYLRIGYILAMYLIIGTLCIIYDQIVNNSTRTLINILEAYVRFSAAPYGWYINMYCGLYLIIPFLNLLYANIQTKKQKQLLIFILVISSALPSVWWQNSYPLTYYFIGRYFQEYKPKLNKALASFSLILVIILQVLITFYQSKGSTFSTYIYRYGFITTLIDACFYIQLTFVILNCAISSIKQHDLL